MTALDIIIDALLEVNCLEQGEVPEAVEAQAAFRILNRMMDAWNTERLMIYQVLRQVFPMNVTKQVWTLGTGGDFNVPRPPNIERAGIINLNNTAQPLELPISILGYDQWSQIPVKNILSALPIAVWDDDGFPLRSLSFYPIPNVAVQVALYTWSILAQFANLSTTDYEFPPGYAECIYYNLAVRLAPSFGATSVNPITIAMAQESRAKVKCLNEPILLKTCEPGIGNPNIVQYNWRTDQPAGKG